MIIKTAEFYISNSRVDKCPNGENKTEFAFIGRSNVGKSSLINMLTNKPLAKTSSTPGKTLLINHFIINNEWYLVDLPGYGYAKRSKKDVDKLYSLINRYILERQQLTNLFVLIDSRHDPQKIDLDFIEFLGENQIPFSIIFTKSDKINKSELNNNVKKFLSKLAEQWEELPKYFISSSSKGIGREEILSYIESINSIINENK